MTRRTGRPQISAPQRWVLRLNRCRLMVAMNGFDAGSHTIFVGGRQLIWASRGAELFLNTLGVGFAKISLVSEPSMRSFLSYSALPPSKVAHCRGHPQHGPLRAGRSHSLGSFNHGWCCWRCFAPHLYTLHC